MKYDHKQVEKETQEFWNKNKIFESKLDEPKPKYYILDMFPYPSGEGLHVGHVKGYSASDAIAHYRRLNGFNVLHPMGWDAFGLPAENYALKLKKNPAEVVKQNIINFKKQLQSLGFSYDWDREINTTDPGYYKWTQWIFLKLFEKGLAYQSEIPINFCPSCKTGLANEEVVGGECERCHSRVERKKLKQWILKITDYADRLLNDLDDLDWPEPIKEMQKNWIGKSQGSKIIFKLENSEDMIEVFTTRADTLLGCTWVVLAPEHELVDRIVLPEQKKLVTDYLTKVQNKSDIERTGLQKEKTGVFTGAYAINPINGEKVPVWVADYVLSSYGSGAVMAVPAHDERDFEFAINYSLPIKSVIKPADKIKSIVVGPSVKDGFKQALKEKGIKFEIATSSNGREHIRISLNNSQIDEYIRLVQEYLVEKWWVETVGSREVFITKDEVIKNYFEKADEVFAFCQSLEPLVQKDKNVYEMLGTNKYYHDLVCFTDYGILSNSGEFNGQTSEEAKKTITKKLESLCKGGFSINYKLRDWVFSRQRYWGEPIPVVHCDKCGIVALDEKDLPLELPYIESYEPTGTGESPLAKIDEWVNTSCPKCAGAAKRETNTMPQWAGSCWYYLRFADPNNYEELISKEADEYYIPVDFYIGGAEHAVLHLLYARFWHKFLFDIEVVKDNEPFKKLRNVGLILAPDNQKMSKSRGNVINPDKLVEQFGADSLRMYELFIGPFDQPASWNVNGISGTKKFLDKVVSKFNPKENDSNANLDQLIARITMKLQKGLYNTAISDFMKFANENRLEDLSKKEWTKFLILLTPFAPHISEFLNLKINKNSVFTYSWPNAKITNSLSRYTIQVNGKKKGFLEFEGDEKSTIEEAKKIQNVAKDIKEKNIKKTVFVKDKVINFVV
jgi:leucyl-tRNA synthetase